MKGLINMVVNRKLNPRKFHDKMQHSNVFVIDRKRTRRRQYFEFSHNITFLFKVQVKENK